jgi:hypothetical protein
MKYDPFVLSLSKDESGAAAYPLTLRPFDMLRAG